VKSQICYIFQYYLLILFNSSSNRSIQYNIILFPISIQLLWLKHRIILYLCVSGWVGGWVCMCACMLACMKFTIIWRWEGLFSMCDYSDSISDIIVFIIHRKKIIVVIFILCLTSYIFVYLKNEPLFKFFLLTMTLTLNYFMLLLSIWMCAFLD